MLSGTLGHYRIVRLIGRGGMGEVYLADDTLLGRQVALKILPPELSAGDRRERFDREARAVAALNHPNIVTLHSIDRAGDTPFLTMEFVDGKGLGELIPATGLPLDRLLKIAIPLADAVGAAHQRGILHRDLKPANVMVTGDGRVKVLDFGLAKLQDAVGAPEALPTQELTGEGRILGTVAYMSPEQAEGKSVDQRSDVFSLGVMLYELATGTRPFTGGTSLSVLSAILKDTPRSIADIKPELPRDFTRIIRRALNKDPEERYQSAKDLRNDLQSVLEDLGSGQLSGDRPVGPHTTPARRSSRGAMPALAAVAVLAMLLAAGWLLTRARSGQPESSALPETWSPVRLTSSGLIRNVTATGAVSPDGRYVAYSQVAENSQGLWLRQVATGTEVVVRPPERSNFDGITFSADGSFIYYSAYPVGNNSATLYRVPVIGGVPQKLLENLDTPVAFSPDGSRMAFVADYPTRNVSTIDVANSDGSGRRRLAERIRSGRFAVNPGRLSWSPDGSTIAAPIIDGSGQTIALIDAATGALRMISDARWSTVNSVQWLPGGRDVMATFRDASSATPQVWRVDVASGRTTPITRDLFSYVDLGVTADGATFVTTASLSESTLWAADADVTKPVQITTGPGDAEGSTGVDWLPDGGIVYTSRASGNMDIWRLDPKTGVRQQLTADPADDSRPSVSPDGRSIAFVSNRQDGERIWVMHADGSNPHLVGSVAGMNPFWTPDSASILFSASTGTSQVNVDGGGERSLEGRWPARPGEAAKSFIARAISRQGLAAGFELVDPQRGGGWQLAFAPLDAAAPVTTLERTTATTLTEMAWAPDGKAIDVMVAPDSGNIWRYPIDGTKGFRLTAFTGTAVTRAFAWSADGRLLLSRGENKTDLVLFKRPGGR